MERCVGARVLSHRLVNKFYTIPPGRRMTAIAFIWLGIEALGLVDALRHSGPDWDYADRDRSFWVIFMFFFGPLFVIPYLFMVHPRFPGQAARERASQFTKR
jgi:hypothetical protein